MVSPRPRALLGVLLAVAACGHEAAGAPDASRSVLDAAADVEGDAPCAPFDAGTLDEDAIQPGADLVVALKCRKCHGDDLSGNPGGVQTDAGFGYPPNITPDPATGLGCWTNAQIESAFLDGVDDQGRTLCPPMPRFAEAGVDAASADEIVTFLRSVPARVASVPDTTCAAGPVDASAE